MAKYTLSALDDTIDFAVIGISCAEEQYAAVAIVDELLGIQLQLVDYVSYMLKDNKLFLFSLFQYEDDQLGLHYSFIPNLSNFEAQGKDTATASDLFGAVEVEERLRLIKELPKTDYFLLLKGEALSHYSLHIANLLRQSSEIVQVTGIDAQDLPSRRNLIF